MAADGASGHQGGAGRVVDRLVVDLHPNGQAQVAAWLDGDELPDPGPAFELAWPLDDDALAELQWYLEDYLAAPFGVYEQRGPQVQARLAGWGSQVFGALFGSGPARDAYVRLRARTAGTRLVIRSSSSALLGLPWELMRDPDRPTPLALDLAGMSRSLPTSRLADTAQVPGGRLRVLMVISRPLGARDVGYQMIARPLLRRLEAVRGEVDLVVLRPPTLEALAQELARAADDGEPFQVMHFDGHGILNGRRAPRPGTYAGQGPEGMLVFEKPDGGADRVPASQVAQVLKAAAVPVVVLNACQSGAIGKELEAAVATRLLAEGTASVVAMAYTVYAVAASEFMAAFYERLFAGDPVSAAVTAGRQRMSARNGRPSPKGDMPLDDWLIPVHYLRRDDSFPQARTARTGSLSLDAELDKLRRATDSQGMGELDPVGSFTGRDGLFYELEVAARLQRVLVLHGPGGTGKTELAKAFGRWRRDTGGVEHPGFVCVHSFEPGVATFGLDGVINEIGLRLFGADFALRETGERQAVVESVLAEHRMLLIWDNFETVRSMPDPDRVTKPLDEDGCQQIKTFLARLAAGGRSAVLITSRSPELWLGDVRRITVGGLTPREADEYANYLLAPYPAAAPRRAKRAFGELMEWLDGHPLSMRLILPHLDTTEPSMLLEALRGTALLPTTSGDEGTRTTSLPASIAYSYVHLAESTRRLLPAVSLFQAVADEVILAAFSSDPDVPDRFLGVTQEAWHETLEDAAGVGLLTPLDSGIYRIHPALPAHLATQWRKEEPAAHDDIRDVATRALVAACAAFGTWLEQQIGSGDAGFAYDIIDVQRRTLGSMLDYAIANALWDEAAAIVIPFDSYWQVRGLTQEADAWTDQICLAAEGPDGVPPGPETVAGSLWLFVTFQQATRLLDHAHPAEAEQIYQQVRTQLETLSPSPLRDGNLAATYQQLGRVGLERRRLDDAEDWYRKSLAIGEDLGDKPRQAVTYHQLGVIAQDRRQLDDAEEWYRKSLAIKKDLGDKPGQASTYHQLSVVAEYRGQLDDAEEWSRRSLAIEQDLGSKPGQASAYHELSNIAYRRGQLNEAEEWSRRSLAIYEEFGDKPRLALCFGQLGLLAEARGQMELALEWTVRCVTVFGEFPYPLTGPGPAHLARLTAQLGIAALEECWQRATGESLPRAVREYVESNRPRTDG
jgi:tetratricopeptide (TPR) repeat protein